MYDFMEYCLRQYYKITNWNDDNQYANLVAPSRAILDFPVPHGLSFTMSRLPTPMFKSSYSMHAIPSLNGCIAYLHTSRNLDISPSDRIQFQEMVDHFRIIQPPPSASTPIKPGLSGDYLLFGRMFVPTARLDALYSRRLSPTAQLVITGLSDPRKTAKASHVTTQFQYDTGNYCAEVSFTTQDALFGLRALYNFNAHEELDPDTANGRWSAGGELYYAATDKSAGVSGGVRYRTLPKLTPLLYTPPITFTYTFNPIVGHMSTAYATQVSEEMALCSRFDFNVWSYESDLVIGLEWRSRGMEGRKGGNENLDANTEEEKKKVGLESAGDDINRNTEVMEETKDSEQSESGSKLEGLVKARYGVSKGLALMWEGRYKNILFSLGLVADLNNRSNPVRSVGLEIQYFS